MFVSAYWVWRGKTLTMSWDVTSSLVLACLSVERKREGHCTRDRESERENERESARERERAKRERK